MTTIDNVDILVTLMDDVLDTSNPELIEDVFSCIVYMFKYMQKQLARDFGNLFKYVNVFFLLLFLCFNIFM